MITLCLIFIMRGITENNEDSGTLKRAEISELAMYANLCVRTYSGPILTSFPKKTFSSSSTSLLFQNLNPVILLKTTSLIAAHLRSDQKSPSKMMKNAFYFIVKALFVLKIFKFLT